MDADGTARKGRHCEEVEDFRGNLMDIEGEDRHISRCSARDDNRVCFHTVIL